MADDSVNVIQIILLKNICKKFNPDELGGGLARPEPEPQTSSSSIFHLCFSMACSEAVDQRGSAKSTAHFSSQQ